MEIEASEHVRDFIAEHGGKLYVWTDEHGFGHAKLEPPDRSPEWVETAADGFSFYQDASIGSPDWWRIELHHLPYTHLTAIWDGGRLGAPELGPDAEPGEL